MPTVLHHAPLGAPVRRLTRGGHGTGEAAARVTRTPTGHPEGYLEGFASIYSEAAEAILAVREGRPVPDGATFPTLRDGPGGVAFVDACVRSSRADAAWTALDL